MRKFEHGAIRLGLVHSRKGKYVSDETLNRRRKRIRRNRAILEHCIAINELGQEYTLQQLAELSVSNPEIRRAELMTRIAGFDAVAQSLGQIGVFYTVSAPCTTLKKRNEPPRILRRLQHLREWSHEEIKQVFP